MDIIPKNERRSIKDLQTIPDSYIVLPTTAIHEHVYHLLENDYDGLVKPFLIKKKEGNTHSLKFGLYKDGKILMEPAFDIIIGIHQNRYMPSFHNIYNIIILGKIKSFNPDTEMIGYSYYAFNLHSNIFAGPFDDFILSTDRQFVTVKKDNLYGVFNCYGYMTIPFGKYNWIDGFHGGYVRARHGRVTNGRISNDANWDLIDYHGEIVCSNCYNIWNFYDKEVTHINIQQDKCSESLNKVKLYEKFDYIKMTSSPKPEYDPSGYYDYNKAAREQISDAYEGDSDMYWNTD